MGKFTFVALAALMVAGCQSAPHGPALDPEEELALEEICEDLVKPDTARDFLGPAIGGVVKHLPVFSAFVDSADERRKRVKCDNIRRTFHGEESMEDSRQWQQCVANPCMFRDYCRSEFGDDFIDPGAYCAAPQAARPQPLTPVRSNPLPVAPAPQRSEVESCTDEECSLTPRERAALMDLAPTVYCYDDTDCWRCDDDGCEPMDDPPIRDGKMREPMVNGGRIRDVR